MNAFGIRQSGVDELGRAYRAGELDPVEVVRVLADAAEHAADFGADNAIAEIDRDRALDAARDSAARLAAGRPLGPLDGIPVTVKDSFPMVGLHRWHGSALNAGHPVSDRDGAPVRRLREAGAIPFAKTTMPDFGLVAAGVSSQFGVIRNPWDAAQNAGGSSSGAGAALAAGIGPIALGTDMGGSIRVPSALCGVVGLKPTQGRVAYDPPKLVGSAGPMARTVRDVALLLEVVGQPDDSDHLSLPGRFRWDDTADSAPARGDFSGIRVALHLDGGAGVPVDDEVAAAVEAQARVLERLGATVETLGAPPISDADWEVSGLVMIARGLPELLAVPEDRWDMLPAALIGSFREVATLSAADHVRNEKRYEAVRARAAARLNAYDYVLSPVVPMVEFAADAVSAAPSGELDAHLRFTIPYNMTSLPAGSVPVTLSRSGLPIGVQVGGRRFDDGGVLRVMAELERSRGIDIVSPALTGGPR